MKKMKRLLCAALAAAVISGLAATPVSAAGTLPPPAYGAGTVSATDLNVRSGPGMDNSIVATIGENAIAVLLSKTDSEWYKINYNGTVGYAKAEFFKNILTAEDFSATGVVTEEVGARIRRSPPDSPTADNTSKVLGTYRAGTTMKVIGINNGWYKVEHDGKTGYLHSGLMKITGGYSTASSARVSAPTETGNALVDFALQYIGYSYVYGGSSPSGFDCSGFTSYVYKNFGYKLTRNASGQYRDNGVVVSKSELVPGDLVFFDAGTGSITHVGIYIGGGEFVHASSARVGVVVSSLDSSYYLNGWYGAKRVI